MENEIIIKAQWNPLRFPAMDGPGPSHLKPPLTHKDVLDFLCAPGLVSDLDVIKARYGEISVNPDRLFMIPQEPRILEKLVWPLRHAMGAYIVGNFLGTVSICAMVAEMVAMLIFEMSEVKINEQPMSAAI